jgi:hypothetical protein
MRSFLLVAAALTGFAVAHIAAQHIGDYRDPETTYDEGWQVLFNGKDFTGWVPIVRQGEKAVRYRANDIDNQQTFLIKDGLLQTTGTPNGYVRTAAVYDNYVFHVEVRFPQSGNSGVLIHIQRDDVWPKAIECQLYQAHMGRIFPIQGATMDGGEMIHDAANPPGQWNIYEVYSEEGRVATVLNGKLVGLGSNASVTTGYIGLQSEGVPAAFRNIKIKRYTPDYRLRSPK